jgi:hypothetical protein
LLLIVDESFWALASSLVALKEKDLTAQFREFDGIAIGCCRGLKLSFSDLLDEVGVAVLDVFQAVDSRLGCPLGQEYLDIGGGLFVLTDHDVIGQPGGDIACFLEDGVSDTGADVWGNGDGLRGKIVGHDNG